MNTESRIMKKDKNMERLSSHTSHFIPHTSDSRGFTLAEVLVTLAIFTVITGVVLTRYKDFSGGIILSNLAYEVAITIRQAQVYGLSVKNAGSSNFNIPYGIHLPGPVSNSFVLFADVDNDGYDSSEIIETLTTRQGNTIQSFCATTVSSITKCSSDVTSPLMSLDITFLRPEPDAKFKTDVVGDVYKEASITVSSPGTGRNKTINVKSTGQISVQ